VCTDNKSDLNRGKTGLWWRSRGFSDGNARQARCTETEQGGRKGCEDREGIVTELQYYVDQQCSCYSTLTELQRYRL
jgi:hypothetical protein